MTTFSAHYISTQDELLALRSALTKIETAGSLVDRMLTYDAPVERTEALKAVQSEIRTVLTLIKRRLQQ